MHGDNWASSTVLAHSRCSLNVGGLSQVLTRVCDATETCMQARTALGNQKPSLQLSYLPDADPEAQKEQASTSLGCLWAEPVGVWELHLGLCLGSSVRPRAAASSLRLPGPTAERTKCSSLEAPRPHLGWPAYKGLCSHVNVILLHAKGRCSSA